MQREIQGLLDAGLDIEIRSIWGGGTEFAGRPVIKFNMWELIGVPYWLLYWGIRKPRVIAQFLGYLVSRPCNWLNFQEIYLGAGYGLLKANLLRKSGARKMHTTWATMPATTALMVHRLVGIPYSIGAHAYDIYVAGGDGLLKEKVESAQFIQSSNQTARAELIRRFPNHSDKMHCIRRCLTEMPPYIPRGPKSSKRLSFLSVGRLVPKKGFLNLLRLVASAKSAGYEWSIKIVGEGPQKEQLAAEMKRLDIEDRVSLTGPLDFESVKREYGSADAFLFAGVVAPDGDRDGLPNVIPEAMAYSLPVLAEPNPGVQEAIVDGETGWLVEFQNTAGAIQKIEAALSSNDSDKVLENAYNWVQEHFDISRTAAQLIKLHSTTEVS